MLDHTSWGYAGSGNGQTHSRSSRLSGGGPREAGEAWGGLPEFSRKPRWLSLPTTREGSEKVALAESSAPHSPHLSVRASRAQQAPPSLTGAVRLQAQVESLQSGP